MKIKTDDIPSSEYGSLKIDFEDFMEGINSSEKIRACLYAELKNFEIIIRGNIGGNLSLSCDRCLKEFMYPLNIDIYEKFVNREVVSPGQKEFEITENDFVTELNGKKEIDITDLIYQSILLELPSKNLCDENCDGFKNFSDKIIDERLEVFRTFSENNFVVE